MKLTLLFVLVFNSVIIGNTARIFKGIEMCRRDCRVTKGSGCTGIHYNPVHLACRLLFGLQDSGQTAPRTMIQSVDKMKPVSDFLKRCSPDEELVVTKVEKHICVSYKADNAQDTAMRYPRLLLVATKVYQLDLKTNVYTALPFRCRKIACVTYMKYSQQFLVCCSYELISTSIPNFLNVCLKRGISVLDIVVDEDENIIFVKIMARTQQQKVYRMNPTGKHFFCVDKRIYGESKITIDRKRKLLYIYASRTVTSFTYDGTQTQDLVQKIGDVTVIFYNPRQDDLYYIQNCFLMKVTKTGEQEKITHIDCKNAISAESAKFHGNHLYISVQNAYSTTIVMMQVTEPFDTQTMTFNVGKTYESDQSLCLF